MSTGVNLNEEMREKNYFHFTSKQFAEDFCVEVVDVVRKNLSSLQDILCVRFPEETDKIKEQVKILQMLYLERATGPLVQFQKVAKEIFALPSEVVIPGIVEDEVVTKEEYEKLEKEVEDLYDEYLKEVCYRNYLQHQQKKFEEVQPLFDKVEALLELYEDKKVEKEKLRWLKMYEELKRRKKEYLMLKSDNRQLF